MKDIYITWEDYHKKIEQLAKKTNPKVKKAKAKLKDTLPLNQTMNLKRFRSIIS